MQDISKKLEGGDFCCNMHVQKKLQNRFFQKAPYGIFVFKLKPTHQHPPNTKLWQMAVGKDFDQNGRGGGGGGSAFPILGQSRVISTK